MLHIITPLYRFDLLEKVYNSIFMDEDIIWHISKSNRREDLTYNFLKTDKRIKVYNVDCEDNNTTKKRNEVLGRINDGYFCFLDDDTIFHENMYMKYRECTENNFVGMLVGEQLDYENKLRLIATKPVYCQIDTGNVLCHTSCLKSIRWPEQVTPKYQARDFLFWNAVFEFYGKKCGIWNQPISYYNKLNNNNNGTKKKTNTITKPR